MPRVGRATVVMDARTAGVREGVAGVTNDLERMQKQAARLRRELSEVNKTQRAFARISARGLGLAAIGAGAVAAARGFQQMTLEAAAMSKELQLAASGVGLTVSQFDLLRNVFTAGAGLQGDEAVDAIRTIDTALQDAADGVATYADAFEKLGVSVVTASGALRTDTVGVLEDIAEGLTRLNPTEQVAALDALGGDVLARLVPLLNEGSTAFRELVERMREQGTVSQFVIDQNAALAGEVELVNVQVDRMKQELAAAVSDTTLLGYRSLLAIMRAIQPIALAISSFISGPSARARSQLIQDLRSAGDEQQAQLQAYEAAAETARTNIRQLESELLVLIGRVHAAQENPLVSSSALEAQVDTVQRHLDNSRAFLDDLETGAEGIRDAIQSSARAAEAAAESQVEAQTRVLTVNQEVLDAINAQREASLAAGRAAVAAERRRAEIEAEARRQRGREIAGVVAARQPVETVQAQIRTELETATTAELEKQQDALNAQQAAYDDVVRQLERQQRLAEDISLALTTGLQQAILDAESLGDVLRGIARSIAGSLLSAFVVNPLTRGLTGLFGGTFQGGGRPPVGRVSVVGERGPELFVPDVAGTIVPNSGIGDTFVFSPQITATDEGVVEVVRQELVAAFPAFQRTVRGNEIRTARRTGRA